MRGPSALFGVAVSILDLLGDGVEHLSVGQRVADLTIIGSYASYVIRPAASVVPVPDEVDPAQAAALVLSWVTAYQMLHRVAALDAGSTILVHGAADNQAWLEAQVATWRRPRHIGIIMDGNRRFARLLGARNVAVGHQLGADAGRAHHLRALADLELDVVELGTERNRR